MSSWKQRVVLSVFGLCSCWILSATPLRGATPHNLRVGVAKVDITPKDFTGLISVTRKQFQGVHDPIYARALVLDNGVNTVAIVELDLVEFGDTTSLRQRITRELAIPADHIMIAATHDHSAPRGGPPTPGTSVVTEGRPKSSDAYTKLVDDSIVEVLRQAKASLQPARVGLGTGKVSINVQRTLYSTRGWTSGSNEDGFADPTVWVLKFEDLSGAPIAILMNYAVHSNSSAGEPGNMITGDIAGMAEKYVERHYQDKAVALFSMGAAADQYPKFNYDRTDPSTTFEPSELQGGMLGAEVLQVAKGITTMSPVATLDASQRAVPCQMAPPPPPRAAPAGGQQQQAQQPPPPQPPPPPGATLDIQMGLIRINQIAITSVSGEVFTEIYAHLKKESPFADTMMITLVNDRVGYIPDDAEWDRLTPAYVKGCAEKAIVDNLVDMMNATIQ
jgi:neutral ceramidase